MLQWLIETTGFLPRSHCGPSFTSNLIFNSQVANLIIFVSYLTIPFSLIFLWIKRHKDIPSPYVILLFAHFIFFCSLTHFNNYLAFNWPAYRYFVFIEDLTAVASLITAIVLPFTVTYLLSLPSFEQLRFLNQNLSQANERNEKEIELKNRIHNECKEHNEKMKLKLSELESQINHKRWLGEKYAALEELKNMLEMNNEYL